jgi:segregation and condensation protein B
MTVTDPVSRRLGERERIVESLLFLSPDPVLAVALAEATDCDVEQITDVCERLRAHYESDAHGLVLRELAGGYTLSSHPDAETAARALLARPRTPRMRAISGRETGCR